MTTNSQLMTPQLPSQGFLRLRMILPYVGFSQATLWRKVKDGTFPKPIKISERITAWRAEEVNYWIEHVSNGKQQI